MLKENNKNIKMTNQIMENAKKEINDLKSMSNKDLLSIENVTSAIQSPLSQPPVKSEMFSPSSS